MNLLIVGEKSYVDYFADYPKLGMISFARIFPTRRIGEFYPRSSYPNSLRAIEHVCNVSRRPTPTSEARKFLRGSQSNNFWWKDRV